MQRLPDQSDLQRVIRRGRLKDGLFQVAGILLLALGVMVMLWLVSDMLLRGMARLEPAFFTHFPSRHAEQAGILSAWVGSLLVMLVTALAAVPVGVAAGLYLEEYAGRTWVTSLIEINLASLAAVPSIVYGLLALGVFVYGLGLGHSVLTAGLTLALLILPYIIVTTREAIRSIPAQIREASMACGATRWQTCRHHLLPYALPGVLTGVIIGLARAVGETAPLISIGALTFIAFLPPMPFSESPEGLAGPFEWLLSPFTVLPIQVFNWTSRPDPAFEANAAAAAFVLMGLVLVMNGLAIWLRFRLRKTLKW